MVKRSTKDEYVTKSMLDEAVEAILGGIDNMFKSYDKKIEGRFDHVDDRFSKVETQIIHLRQDIREVKHDTPSKREFEELKLEVHQLKSSV